jgi:hypothetical protein
VSLSNKRLHLTIVRVTLCAGAQSAPPTLAGEANVRCRGNRLKLSIILIICATFISGVSYANDAENLYGPVPQSELSHASDFLKSKLGAELVDESVNLVASGFEGTRDDILGYWVAYKLTLPSMPEELINILLQRKIREDSWSCTNGNIPECVSDSKLCQLSVSSDDVLQQAKKSGFIVQGVEYELVLGIFAGIDGFSWRVTPVTKRGVCPVGNPVYIVNAKTGNVEQERRK